MSSIAPAAPCGYRSTSTNAMSGARMSTRSRSSDALAAAPTISTRASDSSAARSVSRNARSPSATTTRTGSLPAGVRPRTTSLCPKRPVSDCRTLDRPPKSVSMRRRAARDPIGLPVATTPGSAPGSVEYTEIRARVVAETRADEERELDLLLVRWASLVTPLVDGDLDGVRTDASDRVFERAQPPDEHIHQVGVVELESQGPLPFGSR